MRATLPPGAPTRASADGRRRRAGTRMYEDKKKNSLKKIEKKDMTLDEIGRVRPAAAPPAIALPAPRAARAGADPRASRAARRRSSTRTSSRGSRS